MQPSRNADKNVTPNEGGGRMTGAHIASGMLTLSRLPGWACHSCGNGRRAVRLGPPGFHAVAYLIYDLHPVRR
jgi:hypothetical protein